MRNSAPHCSVRWFGTTNSDLWASPIRFASIAAAAISNVFPAPTQCASKVLFPYNWCATAFFWWGFNVISGFMPGNSKWLPSNCLGRIELNFSLYRETNISRRSLSLKTQSLNFSFIMSCFWLANIVSFLFNSLCSFPSSSVYVSKICMFFRFKELSSKRYAVARFVPYVFVERILPSTFFPSMFHSPVYSEYRNLIIFLIYCDGWKVSLMNWSYTSNGIHIVPNRISISEASNFLGCTFSNASALFL